MGRSRKGYNWRARQRNEETKSEKVESSENTVVLEDNLQEEVYSNVVGDTNELIVENKEKPTRKTKPKPVKPKKLSRSQRKRLEKIVEKKQKKARREAILKELEKHAVSKEELEMMSSASRLGQLNRKRKLSETVNELSKEIVEDNVISSISKGRKRAKKIRLLERSIKPLPVQSGVTVDKHESESDEHESASDNEDNNDNTESDCDENIERNSGDSVDDDSHSIDNIETPKSDSHSISDQDKEMPKNQDNLSSGKTKEISSNILNTVSPTPYTVKPRIPAIFVQVNRDPEIQAARLQLPILSEEQSVMEAIKDNDVVIVCGETGSGKTTQVPQFLYEAGYTNHGMIGVTEPRRVAAVSMSERVAKEMNMDTSKVSYQIRYQGNCTDETVIKFMTDGVLLKEVENDFLLSKYSVIVVDEAHERSVFTDILIGLLSRIVPLRNKQGKELKLIIMSATLRTEDFTQNTRLFSKPPVSVKVDSRQFPVTVHFNKRTPDNFIDEAFRKISKIHRTLPAGGILVFVTGQSDVQILCKKLRRSFPFHKDFKKQDCKESKHNEFDLNQYPVLPLTEEYEPEDEVDDLGQNETYDEMDDSAYTSMEDHSLPMCVLPLYSLLSNKEQAKVFKEPPDGTRLCVVATNVAETSLTIPNIKYVVDTGMVKRRYYDKVTGVSSFRVGWTSKASANQRAGRAGRVEPGHCYRLYSSAVFANDFEEFAEAEISRRPVDDLMLQMKTININKVVNFPFPTPPSDTSLQTAERLLLDLGALEMKKTIKGNTNAVITALGRTMSSFPVSPRYAKMLCLGHQQNCLEYIIAIVSALTVNEIFIDDIKAAGFSGDKEEFKKRVAKITQLRRRWAGFGEAQKLGDLMVLLRAVGACEYAGCTEKFCFENGLRHKGMVEIRKLRTQLTNVTNLVSPDSQVKVDPQMKPPTVEQCKALRQIVLSGLGDRVARKIPSQELKDPKLRNAYISDSLEDPVFIHPKSALFQVLPEFVVYQEVMETTKLFMKGVTAIEQEWLPVLLPNKCSFSKPEETPQPRFDDESGTVKCHITCTFGSRAWQIPVQELEFPFGLDRYRWFARFLLEGKVIPALLKYVPVLLGTPISMIKSWSNLQPRTQVLLSELVSAEVDNRNKVIKAFQKDNKFLLDAYKQWIPQSKHKELSASWPPC